MSLPNAIQRQVDSADAFTNSLNGQAPAAADTQNTGQMTQAPQEVRAAKVLPPAGEETWEARFNALNGKYSAEVPRLSQQARETQNALQTMIAENEALRAAQRPVAPQAQAITDSEREAYGPDLVDLMERVAKSNMAQTDANNAKVQAENDALKKQMAEVQEHVATTAKDRFIQQLSAAVPDWQTVNADIGFLRWLGETDPVYGLPRQAGLDNAYQALDAARTARIFEAYRGLTGTPARSLQQELQSQVAPTSSRGASAPTQGQTQGRSFTQAEISAIYADARRGNIDAAEADRLYQEIDAAVAEGRVR